MFVIVKHSSLLGQKDFIILTAEFFSVRPAYIQIKKKLFLV